MNAIKVIKKTVVVAPARMAEVSALTWRTLDDGFNRRLRVIVNGAVVLMVEGAEYDALGQWTDDTIKGIILAKLGLVEA